MATTGTTGEPIYVAMTDRDLDRLGENERRGFSWLGAKPGDRYHIAITLDNLFVAGLAYHLGLHRVGAAAMRVGAQPVRRHLDLMKQLRPDGIVAVPSLLLALANQARSDGDDLGAFAPRKAMLIGDAIRDRGLGPNALGRALERAWGGELFSTYGLTEAGLAFHECPVHQGLHSHPDLVVVEIVDDAGRHGAGRRDRRTGHHVPPDGGDAAHPVSDGGCQPFGCPAPAPAGEGATASARSWVGSSTG